MADPDINSESKLVRSLSKGNLMAFNSLYKMYSRRLYRFACSYLRNEAEAEELVQEVFTTIWEKRSDLKEELSFRSFLFTIAFNIIKKHFRTRTCLNLYLESRKSEEEDHSTFQKISHDSLYQYITSLVDRLPEKRREIFIRSRFDGLSIKEISEELGISHKTVENQLTEALRFLRIHLNNADK